VLDLGDHYLADFINPGESRGYAHPLRLAICQWCTLLQLTVTVPRTTLYNDRYSFRSGTNEAIRNDLASVVQYALGAERHPASRPGRWLDIASNDGTLLSFVPRQWERSGVDPLKHLAGEAWQHATRLITDFFSPWYYTGRYFDVVTSVSMFYDLDDPDQFACGVRDVLARDGVWVIQQNYALDMLHRKAVDNVLHEHVTYFSVTSLKPLIERHGLEISDVAYSDVNGGCFRVIAGRRGVRPVRQSVSDALAREDAARLGEARTWAAWGCEVRAELASTRDLLLWAQATGKRVCLYGASARSGTFLQMIGAGPDLIGAAADRSEAKAGKVMASTGIPVISEEQMRADQPDYLLVGPWYFREVFTERERDYLKAGGSMIFPLPQFEVVTL
jgi:hypothetical protein